MVFLGTCLAIRGFLALQGLFGLSDDWRIVVSLLFIYVPLWVGRLTGSGVDADAVWPEPWAPALGRAVRVAAGLVLIVYPLFVLGNHVWQVWGLPWITRDVFRLSHPIAPHHPVHGLPQDLLLIAVWQVAAVGYAEEFFYRGWMQGRLTAVFGEGQRRVLGAPTGAAVLWTAALFTLGHSLVVFQWWQPFIFFPALLFGWLRARTGNIFAGVLFHAFANTAMITLDTLYGLRPP